MSFSIGRIRCAGVSAIAVICMAGSRRRIRSTTSGLGFASAEIGVAGVVSIHRAECPTSRCTRRLPLRRHQQDPQAPHLRRPGTGRERGRLLRDHRPPPADGRLRGRPALPAQARGNLRRAGAAGATTPARAGVPRRHLPPRPLDAGADLLESGARAGLAPSPAAEPREPVQQCHAW